MDPGGIVAIDDQAGAEDAVRVAARKGLEIAEHLVELGALDVAVAGVALAIPTVDRDPNPGRALGEGVGHLAQQARAVGQRRHLDPAAIEPPHRLGDLGIDERFAATREGHRPDPHRHQVVDDLHHLGPGNAVADLHLLAQAQVARAIGTEVAAVVADVGRLYAHVHRSHRRSPPERGKPVGKPQHLGAGVELPHDWRGSRSQRARWRHNRVEVRLTAPWRGRRRTPSIAAMMENMVCFQVLKVPPSVACDISPQRLAGAAGGLGLAAVGHRAQHGCDRAGATPAVHRVRSRRSPGVSMGRAG